MSTLAFILVLFLAYSASANEIQARKTYENLSIAKGIFLRPDVSYSAEAIQGLLNGGFTYEKNGWYYLHVEGDPFKMGFQHGYLIADKIIEGIEVIAWWYREKIAWDYFRAMAEKVYWDKTPQEYQLEMQGILAGVRAKGYKNVDIWDIVGINGRWDTDYYFAYLKQNKIEIPAWIKEYPKKADNSWPYDGNSSNLMGIARPDHLVASDGCSSFIATGNATQNGEIILAHNTWASYPYAVRYNILVHFQPKNGYAILTEGYPGVIWSTHDWLISGSGLMISETTTEGMNSYYDIEGIPILVRERQATQYATNISDWVDIMKTKNNGAYANMWLVGDAKTNEICRFELGMKKDFIERTFNGMYYSSNFPYSPEAREETTYNWKEKIDKEEHYALRFKRWQQLKEQYYGYITVDHAKMFMADHINAKTGVVDTDTEQSLCGHIGLDNWPWGAVNAKITTSSLALNMTTWAHWGHPCGENFIASEYVAKHPEWKSPWILDIISYPWTLFDTRKANDK
jgi:hypothetical protein